MFGDDSVNSNLDLTRTGTRIILQYYFISNYYEFES
jgi:hypothetical protein